jgi:hypothetical protein
MPTLVPLNLVSSSAHPSRYISLMEKSVLRVATRMYIVFMKQEGKYMKDRVVLFRYVLRKRKEDGSHRFSHRGRNHGR